MTEQVLDLRAAVRGVVRRSWLVAVLLLAGVLAGLWYAGRQTAVYVAQSRVLLEPTARDAAGHPLRDPQTEVYVATSTEVLRLASTVVVPRLTVDQLRGRVSIDSPSADLLDFRASAGNAPLASSVANAVARAYVAFSNNPDASSLQDLRGQAAALRDRIGQLQGRIAAETGVVGVDPASSQAARSVAVVDGLQAQESQSEQALSGIESRINNALVGAQAQSSGARIVDPAVVPSRPVDPPRRRDAAAGALGGLAAGLALALVAHSLDRRPRRRDEIARTVDSPVIASLQLPRVAGLRRGARHLLERWEPGPLDRVAIRQGLRHCAAAGEVEHLVLVSAARDVAGGQGALQVAVVLATMGTPTVVVIHPDGTLWSRLLGRRRELAGSPRPNLRVCTTDELSVERLPDARMVVTRIVAGRSPLALPTRSRRTAVCISASSGGTGGTQLRGAAAACREAGHEIVGVLAFDSDPADLTTGRLGTSISTDAGRPTGPPVVAPAGPLYS